MMVNSAIDKILYSLPDGANGNVKNIVAGPNQPFGK